ncbi:MAG: hypothetical protein JSV44_00925, partial [Candidatus Zixiibacteriota bacterium]
LYMKKNWKIVLILSLLGNLAVLYVAAKALEYRSHINEFRDKYLAVVEEFSCRHVYASENAFLVSDNPVENRIIFLGTQVTQNWNLRQAFSGYEAINRGVFGQRVAGFLLRFKADVLDLKPQAVVIEISSYNLRPNNTIREIKDYVTSMTDLARYNEIKPILTTMIPVRADSAVIAGHESYHLPDSITVYNGWIRQYCAENGIDLIDFNRALADQNGFLPVALSRAAIDLNETGYRRISEATLAVLERR